MKNNLEDKNSHKSLTFNQFLCSAKDPASSLIDSCEEDGYLKVWDITLRSGEIYSVSILEGV